MTEREFRDWVPLMGVMDGCLVSKRGDMTFGWKLTLPTAFTVNEEGYDSIIHSFVQAFKNLPAWCVVHKQDVFRYDIYHGGKTGFFLSDAYVEHFEGREFLNGYSYIFLTFSTEAVVTRKSNESGYFGFVDKKPLPSPEEIRRRADIASTFEHILDSNEKLSLHALTTEELVRMGQGGRDEGVVADFLRAYDLGGVEYNFDFFDDRLQYGERQMKVWYVPDSDAYPGVVSSVKQVSSMSTATTKVFLSGGSPIGYSLRIPHVVNRYVVTVPKSVVEKELDMKKRVDVSFSLYGAENAVNASELEDYLADAANNSAITVKCYTNLMAWPTKEELPAVRNAVVTAFQSELDISVVEDTMNAPLLHYAAIPGAEAELGYENYMNAELISFLCHGLWDGYDFGMKDGVIHVCDRACLTPIRIDIQSKAQAAGLIAGTNAIVVGPTGSGKSFTMNSLVQDYYTSGQHIMIVDVGDSYEGICSVVREVSGGKDGVYNTYDPEHPFTFNPFKGRADWDKVDTDGERTSSGLDYIFSLFKTIYVPKGAGWDQAASSVLHFLVTQFLDWWDGRKTPDVSKALSDLYLTEARIRAEKAGKKFVQKNALAGWKDPVKEIFPPSRVGKDPVFDDFYRYISFIVGPLQRGGLLEMDGTPVTTKMLDCDEFAVSMNLYKRDGVYGFLLNAEKETDLFESRLTVFEVDQIKDNKQLFPLWVLCIMHSFEEKMRALRCQKVMVIEEAWKAIATDTMAEFIRWMWRTARKFSTSAVVVTQDINDLIGSEIIQGAIIQNSDVRILLDQRRNANNFQNAVTVLGLSEKATNLVLSVNSNNLPGYHYKEAFFGIGADYCNVFAIEVSAVQAVCFETDKVLKAPVFALEEKFGSYQEAVLEIVRRGGVRYLLDIKDKKIEFVA